MFLKAAKYGEIDYLRGVSANIICGQEGYFGTGMFQILLDIEEMKKLKAENVDTNTVDDKINSFFGSSIENPQDPCSTNNLTLYNNAININKEQLGFDDDYDIDL